MAVRQPWLSKLAGYFSRLRLILLLFYVVGMAAMPGLIAPAEGAVYTYAPHGRPRKPSELRTMMPRNMPAAHTIRSRALGCNGWLASGPTMNTLSALQRVGIIHTYSDTMVAAGNYCHVARVANSCAGAPCGSREVLSTALRWRYGSQ